MWAIFIGVIVFAAFLLFLFYQFKQNALNLQLTSDSKNIKVKWNQVPKAQNYTVHVGKTTGVYDKVYQTTATEYEIPKEACRKYFIAVKSVSGNCISEFSNEVFAETSLAAPSVQEITKSGERLFVKYSLVPGAQFYNVQVGLSEGEARWTGKSARNIADILITESTCADLYVKVQGATNDCSGVLSETKIFKQQSEPTRIIGIDNAQKITWEPKQGAKQYVVMQKKGAEDFKEIGTSTTASFDLKGLDCSVPYEFMIQTQYEGCSSGSPAFSYTNTLEAPKGVILE